MTSTLPTDTLLALAPQEHTEGIKQMPLTEVTVKQINSLEEFKKKFVELGCLKPAVIKNSVVYAQINCP